MRGAGAAYRVLILTAAMGGGHLQVSRELARRLAARGHQPQVVDMLELMPAPAGRFLRWLYPWMVRRAPWLYDVVYAQFFTAPQRRAERGQLPVRLAGRRLRRLVNEQKPDVVVSTYHLAGVAAARLREQRKLSAPAITFITTFGVHNLWLHPGTDAYITITDDAAREVSVRTGGRSAVVCEPVVRPAFVHPQSRPPATTTAGPPERERLAFIVAGSLGLGPVAEAARVLARAPGWVPIVVCGRNERLRRRLSKLPGVEALGWVEDMAMLMADADVVIDNAAGSSAKEALALGVPVITYRPIAGHGRDDALMMQRSGLTDVIDRPNDLVAGLDRIMAEPARAGRIRRGHALFGTDPARCVERIAAGGGVAVAGV